MTLYSYSLCVCVVIQCLELVLLIYVCVTKTKCSTFTSLMVPQPVFFGLTRKKSRSRTCVFKSFNEGIEGREETTNEVVNYKSRRGRPPAVIKNTA